MATIELKLNPFSHECVDRPSMVCPACAWAADPANQQPRIPVTFYVAPDLHERLTRTRLECGASLAGFCRQAVKAYLDELEAEAQ